MNPPTDESFAIAAAKERERLYAQDAIGHFWRGTRLQPWSARRSLIFSVLEKAILADPLLAMTNKLDDITVLEEQMQQIMARQTLTVTATNGSEVSRVPAQINASNIIDWTFFQPSAACVLWLAHHTPEQWADISADLSAWLKVILTWADANILPDELEPAVRLAHTLRTAHRQLMTLPRPDTATKRRDAGNVPCPSN